ncbi:MAG: hypothetical protein MZW92_14335 [Comamonadaceae bacterium]|nr:hypothetical protein [Comamonadaceae bacterium]
MEIKAPEEYDVKRGKWSFAHLPVVPPHFDLAPIDKAKSRLNAVVKLVKRKDVGELDQRLRRRARGRADLPPDRAVRRRRQGRSTSRSRRLWLQSMTPQAIRDGFEQLRSDEQMQRPGRRRAQPLRGRLAGGHQRHARDDGLQLARRRLLPDHRGPRADADAVDRGRARGEDPQARARATTGRCKATFDAAGRQLRGQVVRPEVEEEPDDAERARRPAVERGRRRRPIADAVRGQPASVTEEAKPSTQSQPAAVRPDDAAARGQLALRLLGQDHAVARAGAVREAQGADLPAHRLARAARGLPRRWSRRPSR